MKKLSKPLRRSKKYSLDFLGKELGRLTLKNLNRERIIEFGRKRAKQGAGPATLGIDIAISIPSSPMPPHVKAVHGIDVSKEDVDLARLALRRLGLNGRSVERNSHATN